MEKVKETGLQLYLHLCCDKLIVVMIMIEMSSSLRDKLR